MSTSSSGSSDSSHRFGTGTFHTKGWYGSQHESLLNPAVRSEFAATDTIRLEAQRLHFADLDPHERRFALMHERMHDRFMALEKGLFSALEKHAMYIDDKMEELEHRTLDADAQLRVARAGLSDSSERKMARDWHSHRSSKEGNSNRDRQSHRSEEPYRSDRVRKSARK